MIVGLYIALSGIIFGGLALAYGIGLRRGFRAGLAHERGRGAPIRPWQIEILQEGNPD